MKQQGSHECQATPLCCECNKGTVCQCQTDASLSLAIDPDNSAALLTPDKEYRHCTHPYSSNRTSKEKVGVPLAVAQTMSGYAHVNTYSIAAFQTVIFVIMAVNGAQQHSQHMSSASHQREKVRERKGQETKESKECTHIRQDAHEAVKALFCFLRTVGLCGCL